MNDRQRQVLDALDSMGRPAYSRELAEALRWEPLRTTVPQVQRELHALEELGCVVSWLVRPGPGTFRGGMLRRYYYVRPAEDGFRHADFTWCLACCRVEPLNGLRRTCSTCGGPARPHDPQLDSDD